MIIVDKWPRKIIYTSLAIFTLPHDPGSPNIAIVWALVVARYVLDVWNENNNNKNNKQTNTHTEYNKKLIWSECVYVSVGREMLALVSIHIWRVFYNYDNIFACVYMSVVCV